MLCRCDARLLRCPFASALGLCDAQLLSRPPALALGRSDASGCALTRLFPAQVTLALSRPGARCSPAIGRLALIQFSGEQPFCHSTPLALGCWLFGDRRSLTNSRSGTELVRRSALFCAQLLQSSSALALGSPVTPAPTSQPLPLHRPLPLPLSLSLSPSPSLSLSLSVSLCASSVACALPTVADTCRTSCSYV
jgi:hypothetical protein